MMEFSPLTSKYEQVTKIVHNFVDKYFNFVDNLLLYSVPLPQQLRKNHFPFFRDLQKAILYNVLYMRGLDKPLSTLFYLNEIIINKKL